MLLTQEEIKKAADRAETYKPGFGRSYFDHEFIIHDDDATAIIQKSKSLCEFG